MNPRSARALVFDLDGTLVDSRADLAAAVNRMRLDLGLDALPMAAVVRMVGKGARNLVRSALGGEPAEALVERALELFLAHYEPACTVSTAPYAGIPELLSDLAAGFRLALLTNKPERATRRILDHFGWSAWFEPAIGGDTLAARKPEPEGLLTIARRLGVGPGELLMIGDTRIDAETAAAAGAPFALVEWGFATPAERLAIAAEWRVADAAGLARLLLASGPPSSGRAQ
jgi:phosphoglycolate phosphatase